MKRQRNQFQTEKQLSVVLLSSGFTGLPGFLHSFGVLYSLSTASIRLVTLTLVKSW